MKLVRVRARFPEPIRDALDRLRSRYFDETKLSLSRAAVVRIFVRAGLDGAETRAAAEVLGTANQRETTTSPEGPIPTSATSQATRRLRLVAVVVRLPSTDREALDRLRGRYREEMDESMSRAKAVRILVARGLEGADACKASDVLPASTVNETMAVRHLPDGRLSKAATAEARP